MATIVKMGSLYQNSNLAVLGEFFQPEAEIRISDTVPGHEISWVVVNGLLIADRCLLINISWDDLNKQGLVLGKKISIDGVEYVCRLLKVGNEKGVPNEWDEALDVVGDESDDLWHWRKTAFWGQETPEMHPFNRVYRGFSVARLWHWVTSSRRLAPYGFRPVLELQNAGITEVGTAVQIRVHQSIINGCVVEISAYDLVLLERKNSVIAESDVGQCICRLPNGRIIIDRSKISSIHYLDNRKLQ